MSTPDTFELEAKLAVLRRQRGAATLDGKRFDPAAIASLENEIAARKDADNERLRRADRENADALAAQDLADIKELAEVNSALLKDMASIEGGIRQAAASISSARARNARAVTLMARLGKAVPSDLQTREFENRIGRHTSAVMSVPGCGGRLGYISWSGIGFVKAEDDWVEAESAIRSRHLDRLFKEVT